MSREITVRALIELLEEEPEDALVRVMHQPAWPLQEVIGGIVSSEELRRHSSEEDEDESDLSKPSAQIVYLVADGHPRDGSPYGSKQAWEVMRRW